MALITKFARKAHAVLTRSTNDRGMPDDDRLEPAVFAHVRGRPDADGAPGLLVLPDLVLVPRPPSALLDQTAEIEVVVVSTVSTSRSHVERIRVSQVREAGGASTPVVLKIVLERPAANPCTIVGLREEESLITNHVLARNGDLWAALRDLDRVPELPSSVAQSTLEALQSYEGSPRPPQWDERIPLDSLPPDDERGSFLRWLFFRR